jgi:hypothetical protein
MVDVLCVHIGKYNDETSCNCFKWSGEGVELGRLGGSNI